MMPNVVRGDRMVGLLAYLASEGRHNEHTEPHLVAGDEALMVWHGDAELSRNDAMAIARHLDRPRRAFGVEGPRGHVWHCSLSLRTEEGTLTDQQWSDIAGDFVAAMEFDDNQGTKAPCRWAAVHHGLSQGGNDHIHVVVNLVREDGTKANVHNDFHRAQKAARALEVRYGLEQLESVMAERGTRGFKPAEWSRVEADAERIARQKFERGTQPAVVSSRKGWEALSDADRNARIAAEVRLNLPRTALARTVRGCATASESEAEFVRRVRRAGVLIRPRFASGRTDVVTGYSVAQRPTSGVRPIWYGGGKLGRDLGLTRLRENWPDTAIGAGEAAAEWQAAWRGRRVVAPGRESAEPDPKLWQECTADVARLREQLRGIDPGDRETWAEVARRTSGALAAWSQRVETEPGDLAAAADALSTSAQTYRRGQRPAKQGMVAVSGAAMLLASAARGGQGTTAQLAMVRQLLRLSQAVHDTAQAHGEVRHAQRVRRDVKDRLDAVRDQLRTDATTTEIAGPGGGESPATEGPRERRTGDPELDAILDRVDAGQRPAGEAITSSLPRPEDRPDASTRSAPARE